MSYLSYSKNFQGLGDIFNNDPKRYLPLAQLIETLMTATPDLSHAEREMIALHVSGLNACHYCVDSHKAVLKGLGTDEKTIDAIVAGVTDSLEPRLRAMLDFVRTLTLSPGEVSQDVVDSLKSAGWSDQAVENIIGVVSLFSFVNRLVDGFGILGSQANSARAGMIAQHGYGPVVQMVRKAAEAA